MDDLKKKVEALLFSSGRAMSFEELKRLCRVYNDENLKKALQDLKIDYDNRDSSLKLIHEEDTWKIQTKEDFFHIVKKVVTETELKKTLMETLAVIAWKYPIKQSDLIKIRTNKAYDHLRELEEIGYITRQKHGRSKLIKLTDKFFAYFDLPPEKLKSKFSDFNQIANAITNKEKQIEDMKVEHKKQVTEAKKLQQEDETQQKQNIKDQEKEIDLLDKQGHKIELEQYDSKVEEDSPNVSKELENGEETEIVEEENKEEPKIEEKSSPQLQESSATVNEKEDMQEEKQEPSQEKPKIEETKEIEKPQIIEKEQKEEPKEIQEEKTAEETPKPEEVETKEEKSEDKKESSEEVKEPEDNYEPYSEETEEKPKNDVSA